MSASIRGMEVFVLAILGLCFGSFINALVWRIRHKRDMLRERSECTHCHHVLAWYDLLPLVSWLLLRGRCRYCRKPIDDSPIVELVTAALFVVSYVAWPFGWTSAGVVLFVLWLVALIILIALSDYDLRWYLLPDRLMYPLIVIGGGMSYVRFVSIGGQSITSWLMTMLGGVVVIAGLYWVLHHVSRGTWVGYGDVKLSVFIGSILGWQGALFSLFAANVIGCIVVLPALFAQKLNTTSKIPFGPFLITACIIALLWGESIIGWYSRVVVGL